MADKVQCHYVILGVDRKVTGDDIRQAYRKLALQYHPDRNVGNEEKAAEYFKLVQEAYEILSDPQDRAYYDANREKILRGRMGGDDDVSDGVELFQYFSSSCFQKYDDSPTGFYFVYSRLFADIARLEKEDLGLEEEEDDNDDSSKQSTTTTSTKQPATPSSSYGGIDDIDGYTPTSGGIDDIDDYVSTPSYGGIDDIDDYVPSYGGIDDIDDVCTPSTTSQSTSTKKNTSTSTPIPKKRSLGDELFPPFGSSTSFIEGESETAFFNQVRRFYTTWKNFSTRRSFSWHNQWDLRQADNRRIRRLMEEENKKKRTAARLAFNDKVRRLASFIQKRDPRYMQIKRAEELAEKTKREEEARKKKEADAEKRRLREIYLKEEAERLEKQQIQHREMYGDDDDDDYYSHKGKKSHKDWVDEVYECEACSKTFKSENQWKQHENSAKHKKAFADWQKALREELLREEEEMLNLMKKKDAPKKSTKQDDKVTLKESTRKNQDILFQKAQKIFLNDKKKNDKKANKQVALESDEEEEGEDEDVFLQNAMKKLTVSKDKNKKAGIVAQKSRFALDDEDEEEEEEEDEDEDEYEDEYEDIYEDIYEDEDEYIYEDIYEDEEEEDMEDEEEEEITVVPVKSAKKSQPIPEPVPEPEPEQPKVKLNKTQLRKLEQQKKYEEEKKKKEAEQAAAAALAASLGKKGAKIIKDQELRRQQQEKERLLKEQIQKQKRDSRAARKTIIKSALGMAVSAKALKKVDIAPKNQKGDKKNKNKYDSDSD